MLDPICHLNLPAYGLVDDHVSGRERSGMIRDSSASTLH